MPRPSRVSFAILLPLLFVTDSRAERPVDFVRQIRPILSENCYHCHGPDAEQRQADLRLDDEEAAKEWAIIAGSPEESAVWMRVHSGDADELMPPPDSERSLTAEQKALLTRWITEGAKYEPHWAFQPPVQATPPKLAREDSALDPSLTPIDRFIRQRLEEESLRPAEPASKEVWLRRVTFDITGLPPTLAELDAFLADESETAYETVVDRLLASHHYGERMTSEWLDAARYSDTYGYQVDRDRFVWPWRDWVIKAFNENLPYDEFLTWQLAGDLLPNATRDQILATTFNRLHPQKVEGGSVPEEFRTEYVADRVQTVGTAFLGLTLECCRCHTHKYDPLPHADYYRLASFFDNIDEAGLYSYFTPSIPTPTLFLTTPKQQSELETYRKQEAEFEAKLTAAADAESEAFRKWLTDRKPQPAVEPIKVLDFEGKIGGANTQVPGKVGASAVRLTGDDGISSGVGNFRRFDPFSVSLWMKTPDVKERAVVWHRSRAWTDAGSRGYQLLIEEGQLSFSLIHFWPGNAVRIRTADQLPVGEWVHVTCTSDGSGRAEGLSILVNGSEAECTIVRDHLRKQITGGGGDHLTIGQRFRDKGFTNGEVDDLRVYDQELSLLEVRALATQQSLAEVITQAASDAELLDYWRLRVDEKSAGLRQELRDLRAKRCGLQDSVSEIMVMQELPEERETFLLNRGMYDAPTEAVRSGTPEVLPPWDANLPPNRLGLAQWMTRPGHPLTGRVAVNRVWQMLFGVGLVRTPEDFGSQGEPPTHPELLDWLAVDFVQNGWDTKRLIKQIVLSQTYRQSASHPNADRDPENRLLARTSRYRLPAEMLRDNALAVSGLLVDRVGGPPARPYELEVSFKPLKKDGGAGLYRRSLYTFWKRTGPAPVMMTLDAAKRDVCRVKRERTSSPLQAFVMLNGPQFQEAARELATRLMRTHDSDATQVLHDAFRVLTSRAPSEEELTILSGLYERQLTRFTSETNSAAKYLSVGEKPADKELDANQLAATSMVVNTLMNFDECVVRR